LIVGEQEHNIGTVVAIAGGSRMEALSHEEACRQDGDGTRHCETGDGHS
jgi:hypothetical protein